MTMNEITAYRRVSKCKPASIDAFGNAKLSYEQIDTADQYAVSNGYKYKFYSRYFKTYNGAAQACTRAGAKHYCIHALAAVSVEIMIGK